MKIKILYMNDENIPVTVQINGMPFGEGATYNPNVRHEGLGAHQARMFEFDAPEGSIPYVKKWNRKNIVLLTYLPPEAIGQYEESED